ncbi:MAG: metallophosphoesterase [Clostridia bacterium]|nr:metallophosphoesterase [Clostridia bacterium]
MAIEKLFSYGEFEGDGVFDFVPETDFTFCVFSDLHHGYENYNCFRCTEGLARLQRILDESKNADFFLSLGDFADNLAGGVQLYQELYDFLLPHGVRLFNGTTPLQSGERYLYSAVGNHEIAFLPKSALKEFTPIVDGVGNVFAFVHREVLFLAYDAVFSAENGKDMPQDILPTTLFTIPDGTLAYLKQLLDNTLDVSVKSIVAFSHVCLKGIEENAREKLLDLLLSYRLPVYLFEGHAHRENYQVFAGDKGNFLHAFTLPAVCDNDTYNRYEVVMRRGKLLRINAYEKPFDKENQ